MSNTADNPAAAILISGSGTNLQAFIDQVAEGALPLNLAVVVSNRADAFGLQRAARAGIATRCIDHRDFPSRESFDDAVHESLSEFDPAIIILAGFMRILSARFVDRYVGRILNIHPALLPAYPGLNTHQRVIDAGEKWHGCTVHFVTAELDAGPGLLQGRVPVLASDDSQSLSARVQTMEHIIFPKAAHWVATGRAEFRDGKTWLDGKELKQPVIIDWEPN